MLPVVLLASSYFIYFFPKRELILLKNYKNSILSCQIIVPCRNLWVAKIYKIRQGINIFSWKNKSRSVRILILIILQNSSVRKTLSRHHLLTTIPHYDLLSTIYVKKRTIKKIYRLFNADLYFTFHNIYAYYSHTFPHFYYF